MSRRLPAVLGLTLVWVLLWGTFTPLTVVGGIAVAVAVLALFPMPPLPDRLPFRPVALLALVGYLAYDVVASTAEVSWQTLRYGPRSRGAIIAVPLIPCADPVIVIMINALTLSPGTMVLEHTRDVWYVYVLGPRDTSGVERARRQVMDLQRRVLVALGTPDEVAVARRGLITGGPS